jgi:hypothetical protein
MAQSPTPRIRLALTAALELLATTRPVRRLLPRIGKILPLALIRRITLIASLLRRDKLVPRLINRKWVPPSIAKSRNLVRTRLRYLIRIATRLALRA